jgi:hypothetical protein
MSAKSRSDGQISPTRCSAAFLSCNEEYPPLDTPEEKELVRERESQREILPYWNPEGSAGMRTLHPPHAKTSSEISWLEIKRACRPSSLLRESCATLSTECSEAV